MPPKNKKSRAAKESSSSVPTKTLAHYFSKAASKPSAAPPSTSAASTTGEGSSKNTVRKTPNATKKGIKKKHVPLPDDILDLTLEQDDLTVVQVNADDILDLTIERDDSTVQVNADDILDLTLVDDGDDVMEILDNSKVLSKSKKADVGPLPSERNILSLSGLLELEHAPRAVDFIPTPDVSRAPSPAPPVAISEDEEALFMSRLLQSMDASVGNDSIISASTASTSLASCPSTTTSSFVSTAPTSRTASIQSILSSTSTLDVNAPFAQPSTSITNDVEMSNFLAGSDEWDLEDFALTPVKPTRKLQLRGDYSPKCSEKPKRKQQGPLEPVSDVDAGLRDALLRFDHRDEQHRDLAQESCTRCIVNALENEYDSGLQKWRKTLTVRVQDQGKDKLTAFVYLYDDWYFLEVAEGDIINVIGEFTTSPAGESTISLTVTSLNLVILHPDILLTATTLASAPNCTRRPLLASLLRDTTSTTGRATPALVYGSLLHIVAQKALVANDWSLHSLDKWIEEAVTGSEGLGMLLSMGGDTTEEMARRDVRERAKGLVGFGARYMVSHSGQTEPPPESSVSDTRAGPWDQPARLTIESVVDIEEEIWSPRWGMKGKIDATVLATLYEPTPLEGAPKSSKTGSPATMATTHTLPLPLELKTGRASTGLEHRAQTMLYTLLLSERYGVPVNDGLLFYTQKEDGEVIRVPRGWHEVKGLVAVRNGVASWIWKRFKRKDKINGKDGRREGGVDVLKKEKVTQIEEEGPFLPAPVDQEWLCKKCYTLNSCLLFRRTHPDVDGTSTPIAVPPWLEETYMSRTGHITNSRAAFFKKWERLLSLEERDSTQLRTEIWTTSVKDREVSGRCLGGLVLADDMMAEDGKEVQKLTNPIRRFTHTFRRALSSEMVRDGPSVEVTMEECVPSTPPSSTSSSLLNAAFVIGDPVVISAEPDLLAIAQGFVLDLTTDRIVVGVDHELTDNYAKTRLVGRGANLDPSSKAIFRIDKDELSGSMSRVRNNLAQLFYVDGEKKQLELIVDLRAPVFDAELEINSRLALPSSLALNPSQQAAMHKVLTAEDYALILGMPGTGKTTVIAALIHELVRRGKTVLLTSYTHSAVDTILNKVIASGKVDFGILRLGNVDKVHPSVRQYTLDARRQARTLEELERQLCSPPVVATTCLGVEHTLFTRRKFDYCIVDEASQITLPTCLGPIRFADKFVLVGDHYQLPPLVKNPLARAGGLAVSLFKQLSDAHPAAVADLCHQYRMNEDIMLLSNKLIYKERLRCGSDEVAGWSLEVPHKGRVLERLHRNLQGTVKCKVAGDACWIEKLMQESSKAIFVDTDLVPAVESRVGKLPQNLGEANMIHQLVKSLVEGGVRPSQIGVLSLYRQQVKVLQHSLNEVQKKNGNETERVEVLTTDRSQGRDKDCIIISLVRSNESSHTGELIRDWRRMNVAFTRARKKLVIFGSRKTLEGEPLLGEFFALMAGRGWIVQPGRGADTVHEADLKDDDKATGPDQTPRPDRAPVLRATGSLKRMAEDDVGQPCTPTRVQSVEATRNATPRSASMPLTHNLPKSLDPVGESKGGLGRGLRPIKRLRVTPEMAGKDVLQDLNW